MFCVKWAFQQRVIADIVINLLISVLFVARNELSGVGLMYITCDYIS